MSIDLNNSEHERCLRETIALWSDLTPEQHETWLEKLRRDCAVSEHGPREVLAAVEALSDPAKAAELIRRLVERAGVSVKSSRAIWFGVRRSDPHAAIDFATPLGDCAGVAVRLYSVPERILRLLSLAPNAGADAVLAALRGVK